jgi:NADH-quinone oxidoreductase subunit E
MPTVNTILEKYNDAKRDSLIPLLQEVQELEGFLSESAIVEVGKKLKLSSSKIYGVATFYNQFRFDKPGQYQIQICRGTACHVKGSATVLKALEAELAVEAGQTTRDGLFSLEVVACIGACGLAPVISINGEFFAGVKPEDINGILETYRKKATEDDK